MSATTDEETIVQISAEYPGWHVWRARRRDDKPASWIATRLEESAGIDATVMMSTAEQLREALADQRERVGRSGQMPPLTFGFVFSSGKTS
jgi:hypothetical protein